MKAKRRMNAKESWKRLDLSNVFIVPIIRQWSGLGIEKTSSPFRGVPRTTSSSVSPCRFLYGRRTLLPARRGEHFSERFVDVRAVEDFIDNKPSMTH